MAYAWYVDAVAREARLAELLGALSLACDVAFAFPLEKAMRTCVLAVELGRAHGLGNDVVRDVYYSTLLTYTGCTAFAHEVSALTGGDDIAVSNTMIFLDPGDPVDMVRQIVTKLGSGAIALRAIFSNGFERDPFQFAAQDPRQLCEPDVTRLGRLRAFIAHRR